jgi:hypothetical protein
MTVNLNQRLPKVRRPATSGEEIHGSAGTVVKKPTSISSQV